MSKWESDAYPFYSYIYVERGKLMLKSKSSLVKLLVAFVIILLLLFFVVSRVEIMLGYRPPRLPITEIWDIRPENSRVALDFEATDYRYYYISVDFWRNRGPNFNIGSDELKKFTGDSGAEIVTKDPVPVVIKYKNQDEYARAYDLVQKGVYEWRYFHNGLAMPVHIKIEKMNGDKQTTVVLDETINTDKVHDGFDREIAVVKLRPGKYHVELQKFKELTLPQGAMSTLHIGWHPKTNVLDDDQ
jgi:hypothetical protein